MDDSGLWVVFMQAAMAAGLTAQVAAKRADRALAEYQVRWADG